MDKMFLGNGIVKKEAFDLSQHGFRALAGDVYDVSGIADGPADFICKWIIGGQRAFFFKNKRIIKHYKSHPFFQKYLFDEKSQPYLLPAPGLIGNIPACDWFAS